MANLGGAGGPGKAPRSEWVGESVGESVRSRPFSPDKSQQKIYQKGGL